MTTFTDDFNRADGPVGNGWSTSGSNVTILSGEVRSTQNRTLWRTPWTRQPTQRARIYSRGTTGWSNYARVYVRYSNPNNTGYAAVYQAGVGQNYVYLNRLDGGSITQLDVASWLPLDNTPKILELVDDDGQLSVYVDGVLRCSASDATYTNQTDVAINLVSGYARADDFYTDDVGTAPTLDVQPDTYEVMGADPPITFTGTDTNWDPETNTPTFTVDKGSITDQVIDSATTAHANYTTPVVEEIATFTDPTTGQTDTLALTANFSVSGGGDNSDVLAVLGTPISEETVLDDLRSLMIGTALTALPKKLSELIVDLADAATQDDFVASILGYLGINQSTEPEMQTLATMLAATLGVATLNNDVVNQAALDAAAIRGEEYLTLRSTINLLCGVPNVTIPDLKALLDAITIDGTYTLLDLYTQIQDVRGVPFMDLRTLYEAVLAIPPLELALVTDYLDWITGTKAVSLPEIDAQVSGLVTNLNGLHDDQAAAFSDLTGAGTNTLQTILNALSTHDNEADTYYAALHTLLLNVHQDLLEDYSHAHAHLTTIETDTTSTDNLAHAIYDKVITLHNTDLAGIVTQLNRIEAKLDAHIAKEATRTAPVWPGLANVTLAAPVTVTQSTVINAVCHGCVVTVNATEPNTSKWAVDTHTSHKYSGYVAFISDRGDVECHQYLGQDTAIYTPTSMASASAILIYLMHATSVTVRPWTLVV